jgi:hypothetical protein
MKSFMHLLPALTFSLLAPVAGAVSNTVTSAADDGGAHTLRTIIANAGSGDIINFTNTLSGQTILLTNGVMVISQNLTIDGSVLPNGISIDGNGASQVFDVTNATVVLNSLTLTNASNLATGPLPNGWGGAIYCHGTLTLNQCQIVNNTAQLAGAIFNQGGILTLNQCRVSGNSGVQDGGVIYSWASGVNILTGCTFFGNVAYLDKGFGGGVLVNDSSSSATLTQCTLSGNSGTGIGGAIYNTEGSSLTVVSCTITGNTNTSGNGGGINNDTTHSATLFMTNSIVAGNTAAAGADIYNPNPTGATLGGSNLIQNISGAVTGGYLNAAPQLAPLGNYGGPTPTMPPLPGSPIIDACTTVAPDFSNDQRGYPRIVGRYADIGAVEGVYNSAGTGKLTGTMNPGTGAFKVAFTNYSDIPFTMLASTNLALPLSQWSSLGSVTDAPPGTYSFSDTQVTNNAHRYYRVRSP